MRPSTFSFVLVAALLLAACGSESVEPSSDSPDALESRSDALASVTTLVTLVETTETTTRKYPVILVPGLNQKWSAAFRLLCNNCDFALSAFGFSDAMAQFAPSYYSLDALLADNQAEGLGVVDLPLEPNTPSAILAAYRVVDATEPETPQYLVRLRERPELPYATSCESFLRVAQGSLQTVPINKSVLKYWGLPEALPRLECAHGTAKLPTPAPVPSTQSFGALFQPSAILDAWTATRPLPDVRADRYPYLVTRVDGQRQGFVIDCATAAYDALASFGVSATELRTTPAADAELEATRLGARPTLRCRGNGAERIVAISSPDDAEGRVRFVFEGHRDVVEFLCPNTEAFWRGQADVKLEIPLAALGSLNDFRDDAGATQIHQIGCRFNPLNYRLGKALQWPGSNLCVSSPRNMSAKDPVQLERCDSPVFFGQVENRQAWSYDTTRGMFSHVANDGRPMFLDHPLGSPAGTQLEIYPFSGLDSQRFSLSSGVLFSRGLCLDVSYGILQRESRLWFWPCHGGSAQRFFFQEGTIRPVAAPHLCVDNRNDGAADGNIIWLYDCNKSQAQSWTFNGARLVNPRGCLDLDIANGVVPGSYAQLWQCNGQDNQNFHYYGQIKNKQGHCLDVRSGVEGPGAVVQGAACTGAWSQDFYYVP